MACLNLGKLIWFCKMYKLQRKPCCWHRSGGTTFPFASNSISISLKGLSRCAPKMSFVLMNLYTSARFAHWFVLKFKLTQQSCWWGNLTLNRGTQSHWKGKKTFALTRQRVSKNNLCTLIQTHMHSQTLTVAPLSAAVMCLYLIKYSC